MPTPPAFAQAFPAYLANARAARVENRHHDYRRGLFLFAKLLACAALTDGAPAGDALLLDITTGEALAHAIIAASQPQGGVVQARRLAREAVAGEIATIDVIAQRVLSGV
ncbi:MAG: hypothetical protein FJ011_01915 [Chloroflexi bacterium]|nr:hypothetical protein [Chloroflexota bacterium]